MRKFDDEETNVKPGHGKKEHQKIKPYVVLQYLLKESDENHVISGKMIEAFLREDCDIYAERRSIYRDIEEINKVAVMLDEECTIGEAEEILAEDEDRKLIVYDEHKKGFYAKRQCDTSDIKLLAECVYSAKFIPESRSDLLIDNVCKLVSVHEERNIRHNVLLTDRVKTNNKEILATIGKINDAMSKNLHGKKHVPEKIKFKYLKYTINNLNEQVERRHGEDYVVSPFQMLINDGYYYLLAFDDKKKGMRTYRVDRMRGVDLTNIPREGDEVFNEIDLKSYTQRVFSMYVGKKVRVTIRCINKLLDTVVDKLGKDNVVYSRVDDNHFDVIATVEISNQFYGWLLGFGKEMRLVAPDIAVAEFKSYLSKISEMYLR